MKIKNLTKRLKESGTIGLMGLTGILGACTTAGEQFINDVGNLAVGTAIQEGIRGQLNPNASNVQQNVYNVNPQIPTIPSQNNQIDYSRVPLYPGSDLVFKGETIDGRGKFIIYRANINDNWIGLGEIFNGKYRLIGN